MTVWWLFDNIRWWQQGHWLWSASTPTAELLCLFCLINDSAESLLCEMFTGYNKIRWQIELKVGSFLPSAQSLYGIFQPEHCSTLEGMQVNRSSVCLRLKHGNTTQTQISQPGVKICHLTFILDGLIFSEPVFPLINASEWDKTGEKGQSIHLRPITQ